MAVTPANIVILSQLLDEALELDPAERDRWIAALPSEHAHLAESLREMLDGSEKCSTSDLLSTLPKLADDGAVASAGERLGPYRLVREIGRGGMGSVWLAERADGSFERKVALKLPRLTWAAELADRMARERRIGGLLEHPAIARLYDAGVDEHGRPFFAMEYIDGHPIDVWCREQGLDTRSRLRLFVQVIRAVAYAHGRMVLHRDLKPANVLVDQEGKAHLLDFGIAKLMQDQSAAGKLTLEGGRVMTPQYASPEQISGLPIGVASDIYSLGVTLFEILTGRLPFDAKRASQAAMEEAILEGHLVQASVAVPDGAVRKALRGEIDAILSKAMSLQPALRYATAEAMADDIDRHLNGETVRARPDSAWYRLKKGVIRHRVVVGAATAVFGAVLVGGGFALVGMQRAAYQSERARLATEFVAEMFRASARPSGPATAGLDWSDANLLDHGAKLIQARFPTQPDIQAELYGVIGRIYAGMGAHRLSADYAARQIEVLDHLPEDPPSRVRAMLTIADAQMNEGQIAEAEAQARRAFARSNAEPTLKAECRAMLARIYLETGRLEEARAEVEASKEVLLASAALPNVAGAWILRTEASLLSMKNRFNDGAALFARAVETALRAEGPGSRTASEFEAWRAWSLIERSRAEEARPLIDSALARLRRGSTADKVQAAVIESMHWARLYGMRFATYEDAVRVVTKNAVFLSAQRPPVPQGVTARIDFELATVHIYHGDFTAAEPLIKASVPKLRAATQRIYDLYRLVAYEGQLLAGIGKHDAADPVLREQLDLRRRLGGATSPYAAYDWAYIADNLVMRGDSPEAEAFLVAAPTFGMDHGSTPPIDYSGVIPRMRARIRLELGDAQGALSALPASPPSEEDEMIEFPEHGLLGEILCANGRADEGLRELSRSIRSLSALVGDIDPRLARLQSVAGLCALALGNRAQALQHAEKARVAFVKQPVVSAWYKSPLTRLDRALSRAATAT